MWVFKEEIYTQKDNRIDCYGNKARSHSDLKRFIEPLLEMGKVI